MKRKVSSGKLRYWRDQVRRSQAHPGSVASYCREAGVSVSALGYWRKKLNPRAGTPDDKRSPFVAVELATSPPTPTHPAPRPLPDPKWVAQFILHLNQGELQ